MTLKAVLSLSFLVLDQKHDLECGLEEERAMKSERGRCEALLGDLIGHFGGQKNCRGLFLASVAAEPVSRQLWFNTQAEILLLEGLTLAKLCYWARQLLVVSFLDIQNGHNDI